MKTVLKVFKQSHKNTFHFANIYCLIYHLKFFPCSEKSEFLFKISHLERPLESPFIVLPSPSVRDFYTHYTIEQKRANMIHIITLLLCTEPPMSKPWTQRVHRSPTLAKYILKNVRHLFITLQLFENDLFC